MFSEWFSGDECGQYRTSPHKQRMDHVGSSLSELRYVSEVIRQHLHEWLRFSRRGSNERGLPLLATGYGSSLWNASHNEQSQMDWGHFGNSLGGFFRRGAICHSFSVYFVSLPDLLDRLVQAFPAERLCAARSRGSGLLIPSPIGRA